MKEINGYKIVTLRNKPDLNTYHTVYAKSHSIRTNKDTGKPLGKTLFLLNIPPYISEKDLIFGYSNAGEIETVIFEERATMEVDKIRLKMKILNKFKVGYVVFKSTKSLEIALKMDEIILFDKNGHTVLNTGVRKWMEDFIENVETEETLQKQVDSFMEIYDQNEKKALALEKQEATDEDGWTVVKKKGRNAGFEQKESVINKLEEKMERSKKKRELTNFYTFQIRESKMKHIVSLRRKFEEDKRKIETMKKSRRFNPFS